MSGTLKIQILDDVVEVPAGDSILRALQIYGIVRGLPAYGFTRFCWNAKCQQCILEYSCGAGRDIDYACQTEARDGMQIHSLPEVLNWTQKLTPKP